MHLALQRVEQFMLGGMSMMRPLLWATATLLISTRTSAAHAEPTKEENENEYAAPSMPPSGHLDPDLAAALEAAERSVSAGRTEEAVMLTMPILTSDNRFTTAQKSLLVPRLLPILRRAGEQSMARGNVELGVRAYDAAWHIDPRVDEPYARALVAAADRERSEHPESALWLARRARVVAPTYEPARERDESWSHNRSSTYGYGLMITGLSTVAAGVVLTILSSSAKKELESGIHDRSRADELVSSQKSFGLAAGVAFGAGAITFVSGVALIMAGNPSGSPHSPAFMPAVPDRRQ